MPHYIFDVHEDGLTNWDEEGIECAGRDEIESQVRELLAVVTVKQAIGNSLGTATSVIVHQEGGGVVLTAIAKPGQEIQFLWPPS